MGVGELGEVGVGEVGVGEVEVGELGVVGALEIDQASCYSAREEFREADRWGSSLSPLLQMYDFDLDLSVAFTSEVSIDWHSLSGECSPCGECDRLDVSSEDLQIGLETVFMSPEIGEDSGPHYGESEGSRTPPVLGVAIGLWEGGVPVAPVGENLRVPDLDLSPEEVQEEMLDLTPSDPVIAEPPPSRYAFRPSRAAAGDYRKFFGRRN